MSRFSGMDTFDQPRALALVMCDRIIVDAETQKRSLIDIFDAVTIRQLGHGLPRLSIFISLAKGSEDANEIFVGLFSPSGVAVVKGGIKIDDWGTGQADFGIVLPGIIFAEEGDYDLRVFVAEHVLSQRRLVVRTAPPPPEEQVDSPTP
jgi:hypothetical protein